MGKRGNENSQMRKEDYDEMDGRGSSAPSGTFERASAEVLSSRKIQKPRRPDTMSSGITGDHSSGRTKKSPFASVSFGGLSTSFGGSQSAGTSFGTGSTPSKLSAVGKRIATDPASATSAASSPSYFAKPQPPKRLRQEGPTAEQEDPKTTSEAIKLAEGLIKFIDKETVDTPRTIPTRALDRVLMTLNARINERGRDAESGGATGDVCVPRVSAKTVESAASPTVASATGNMKSSLVPAPGSITGSSFGFGSTAKEAPVQAPAAAAAATATSPPAAGPLFGNNTSTSANLFGKPPASASTPNFSFGTTDGGSSAKAATTSGSSTTVSGSTFQFSPSVPTAPAPAPVAFEFSKTAPTAFAVSNPSSGPGNDPSAGDTAGNNEDDGEDAVREAVDPDWETFHRVGKAKLKRKEDGKYVDVGTGKLSLQRHKSNGTRRLVLHNLGSGNVMANLAVTSGLKFNLHTTPAGEKKPKGQISFLSVLDPDKGPEILFLITKFDILKETANKLNEFLESS